MLTPSLRPALRPPWSSDVSSPLPLDGVVSCDGLAVLSKTRTAIGAAYGTAKSGIGIAGVGTFRPDLIMKVARGCGKA